MWTAPKDNDVTITGGSPVPDYYDPTSPEYDPTAPILPHIGGDVTGGDTDKGDTENNHVDITGPADIEGDVTGGHTKEGVPARRDGQPHSRGGGNLLSFRGRPMHTPRKERRFRKQTVFLTRDAD